MTCVFVALTEFEFKNDSFSYEYRSGTTRIFYQILLSESYPGIFFGIFYLFYLPMRMVSLCLSVCLVTRLLKQLWTVDFHKTQWIGRAWPRDESALHLDQ